MPSPTHLQISPVQPILCYQPHPPWDIICTAHTVTSPTHFLMVTFNTHCYQPHPLSDDYIQHTLCYQPHPLSDDYMQHSPTHLKMSVQHSITNSPPSPLSDNLFYTQSVTSPTHLGMSSAQHKMGVADYHMLCKCTSPSHFALYISHTLSSLILLPNPLYPSFFISILSFLSFPSSLCLSLSLRAASLGHFEVLQVLSAYGADFTVTTSTGDTAVHFATTANRLLCIRFLGQRGLCGGEL